MKFVQKEQGARRSNVQVTIIAFQRLPFLGRKQCVKARIRQGNDENKQIREITKLCNCIVKNVPIAVTLQVQ